MLKKLPVQLQLVMFKTVLISFIHPENELRDWRIYSDFAGVLIGFASPVYQRDNNFRLDIDNLVYAFDKTTISLCLKLCPWATCISFGYSISST